MLRIKFENFEVENNLFLITPIRRVYTVKWSLPFNIPTVFIFQANSRNTIIVFDSSEEFLKYVGWYLLTIEYVLMVMLSVMLVNINV